MKKFEVIIKFEVPEKITLDDLLNEFEITTK
jgi:hypothetical protein